MARSDFVTWLPLDRWAEIIGLNPLHFNQLDSSILFPNNTCGDGWFQHSWQHSDRVGRDDIAMAIQQAEQEISREVGFNLLPDWVMEERLQYPKPANPSAYNLWASNPRGMFQSVETPRGYVISGGMKTKSLIEAGSVIVRSDSDGDGYAETCTVIVPITITDTNEVRAYYAAKDGEDSWEIRPIAVAISGGFATITFKSWQIVDSERQEYINPQPLDATDPVSYETTIDVYRVWNDPSTQAQFIWENSPIEFCGCGTAGCTACQLGTQAGCFHLRDARLGITVPAPASWDVTTLSFVPQGWAGCRAPDQVRLWYYSGYKDTHRKRPLVEMSNYWEYAVAYFAASKLDRPTCGCSNVQQFIDKWRTDAAYSERDGGYTMTAELLSNKLGTSMGALYAYKRVHQNGVRIIK